jgi:hypothetical protein
MGFLDRTYEVEDGPPAEDFDSYAARLATEYFALIEAHPAEHIVQAFLEQHPCLVPGPRSIGVLPSGYPMHSLLISQPRLPGLRSRIPDFMWIAQTSAGVYPSLIEIERPDKAIFGAKRVPSADFSQARHQLAQWRAWFSRPENEHAFSRDYEPYRDSTLTRIPLEPLYFLVYGRRAEFEHDAELAEVRAQLLTDRTEHLLSYDRLTPDSMLRNAITVRATGSGRFKAIAIPPTFVLGPADAKRLLFIDELESVIAEACHISEPRKEFLLRRLPYWREWAAKKQRGVINTGDRE